MVNTFTRRTALSLALQALAARAALARTGPTPFNLGARRMPAGDEAAALLPVTVGGFERVRLPDGLRLPADSRFTSRTSVGPTRWWRAPA